MLCFKGFVITVVEVLVMQAISNDFDIDCGPDVQVAAKIVDLALYYMSTRRMSVPGDGHNESCPIQS